MTSTDDWSPAQKRARRLLPPSASTPSSSPGGVGGRQLYRLRSAASAAKKQKRTETADGETVLPSGLDQYGSADGGDLLVINTCEPSEGGAGDALRRGRMEQILRTLEDRRRSGRGVPSTQQRRQRRLSTAAQLKQTEQGVVDLQTPDSILTRVQIRLLLNSSVFCRLPSIYQLRLASLLPDADHRCGADGNMRLSRDSLSNEFVTRACHQWQERLGRGEFTHDHINKQRSDMESRKRRLDPWKVRNFEPVWGQCPQKRSVSPVSRAAVSALSRPLPQLPDNSSTRGLRRSWLPPPPLLKSQSTQGRKATRQYAPAVSLSSPAEAASLQTCSVTSPDSTVLLASSSSTEYIDQPVSPSTGCVDTPASSLADRMDEIASPCIDPASSPVERGASGEQLPSACVPGVSCGEEGSSGACCTPSTERDGVDTEYCSELQTSPAAESPLPPLEDGVSRGESAGEGEHRLSDSLCAGGDDSPSHADRDLSLTSSELSLCVFSPRSSADRLESTRLSWRQDEEEGEQQCSGLSSGLSDASRVSAEMTGSVGFPPAGGTVGADSLVSDARSSHALSTDTSALSSDRVSLGSDLSSVTRCSESVLSAGHSQVGDHSMQADDPESIASGPGITKTVNIKSSATESIDLAPGSADSIVLATEAADSIDLVPGATGSIDLVPGVVESIDLASGAADSIDLVPGATDSIDLAPGAVESIDLASGAAHSIDLVPGATDSIDLASGATESIDLAPGTTNSIDLAPQTMDPIDLDPGTVDSIDLGPGATDSIDLAPEAMGSIDLDPGTVDSIDLGPGAPDSFGLVSRPDESVGARPGVAGCYGLDSAMPIKKELVVSSDAGGEMEMLGEDVSSVLESSTLTDDESSVVSAPVSSRYPALYDPSAGCLSPELSAPPPVHVPTPGDLLSSHQTAVYSTSSPRGSAALTLASQPRPSFSPLMTPRLSGSHLARAPSASLARFQLPARAQRPPRPRSQAGRSVRHSRPPTGSVNLERSYQICQAVIAKSQNRAQLQAQMKPLPRLLAENRGGPEQRGVDGARPRAEPSSSVQQSGAVKYLQVPGQKVVTAARLVSLPSAGPSSASAAVASQTLVLGEMADNGTVLLRKELLVRGRQKVYQVCDSGGKTMLVVRPVLGPTATCSGSTPAPSPVLLTPRAARPAAEGGQGGSRLLMMVSAPAPAGEDCSCQLRPLVVCQRCGAYCHDDCMHGGATCTACR